MKWAESSTLIVTFGVNFFLILSFARPRRSTLQLSCIRLHHNNNQIINDKCRRHRRHNVKNRLSSVNWTADAVAVCRAAFQQTQYMEFRSWVRALKIRRAFLWPLIDTSTMSMSPCLVRCSERQTKCDSNEIVVFETEFKWVCGFSCDDKGHQSWCHTALVVEQYQNSQQRQRLSAGPFACVRLLLVLLLFAKQFSPAVGNMCSHFNFRFASNGL